MWTRVALADQYSYQRPGAGNPFWHSDIYNIRRPCTIFNFKIKPVIIGQAFIKIYVAMNNNSQNSESRLQLDRSYFDRARPTDFADLVRPTEQKFPTPIVRTLYEGQKADVQLTTSFRHG